MKKLILAACLTMLWAMPAAAQGPYIGGSAGLSVVHDSDLDIEGVASLDAEYDAGFGFNLAAGYNFEPVRLEAEFGYKTADLDRVSGPGGSASLDDSDITAMSFMVNGFYDIQTGGPVTPFVGAGLGLINHEIELEGETRDDTVFGYQFTAGLSTAVNKNLNLDLYYRYQGSSDFEREGVEVSYGSSNIIAGMRYNF